jgi:hypothetical protein
MFQFLGTCVAVPALLLGATACASDDADPAPVISTTEVSTAPTSDTPTPTSTATATKTVEVPVTVTPTKPTTPKPTSTPAARPVKPQGPTLQVKSHERDTGSYPEYVKKDSSRPAPKGYKGHPLICGHSSQNESTSVPIVLALNGTKPTGGKNLVSTLVTERGLLIFPEKGSIMPSDTLIANELLYGNVPAPLLDPTYSSDYSILLPSTSVEKGGWGTITELVVCKPVKG